MADNEELETTDIPGESDNEEAPLPVVAPVPEEELLEEIEEEEEEEGEEKKRRREEEEMKKR